MLYPDKQSWLVWYAHRNVGPKESKRTSPSSTTFCFILLTFPRSATLKSKSNIFYTKQFQLRRPRAFNFGEFVDGKAQQPLPPSIIPEEPSIGAFADSCHALCQKVLYLLGLGLEVSFAPSY